MIKENNFLNQYVIEVRRLKKLGRFFEHTIINILSDIENEMLNVSTLPALNVCLGKKKQLLEQCSNFYPLKAKSLHLIDRIIFALVAIENKKYNEIMSFLVRLPDAILSAIFDYLNKKQLSVVSKVNSKSNLLIKNLSNSFWPTLSSSIVQKTSFPVVDMTPVTNIITYTNAMVSLHQNNKVHVWNSRTGKYLYTIVDKVVGMTKTENFLWVQRENDKIQVWDMQKRELVLSYKSNFYINTVGNYSSDKLILTVTLKTSLVDHKYQACILYIKNNKEVMQINLKNSVKKIALACNSKKYIVTICDRSVIIEDLMSLQSIKWWKFPDPHYSIQQVMIHEDYLIIRQSNNKVLLYDIKNDHVIKIDDFDAILKNITVLMSGYLVLGYVDGTLRVYDMQKFQFLPDIKTDLPISFVHTASTNQIFVGCTTGHIQKLTLNDLECDHHYIKRF